MLQKNDSLCKPANSYYFRAHLLAWLDMWYVQCNGDGVIVILDVLNAPPISKYALSGLAYYPGGFCIYRVYRFVKFKP